MSSYAIIYNSIVLIAGLLYKNIKIKQHSQVAYLGCVLDETFCGEPMALKALNKRNGMLKFLYSKNKFLAPTP